MNKETDMNWEEMKPIERDALVAEKIFGRKIYRENTWGRWLLHHETKPGLTEPIPRYTESMDAAWLVVHRISEMEGMHPRWTWTTIQREFLGLLETTADECDCPIFEMKEFAELTPEKICVAALKSCGVEID